MDYIDRKINLHAPSNHFPVLDNFFFIHQKKKVLDNFFNSKKYFYSNEFLKNKKNKKLFLFHTIETL